MIAIYRLYISDFPNLFYIGSTKDIHQRVKTHKRLLDKNDHHSCKMQDVYNKSKTKLLCFDILENTNEENRFSLEDKYIKKYGVENLLNVFDGAGTFGDVLTKHPLRKQIVQKITSAVQKRYNDMTEKERIKLSKNQKMEKNGNWQGGKSYKYCGCGKRISTYALTCNKCRNRSSENNPFFGKKHTKETIDKIMKNRRKITPKNSIKVKINGVIYESNTHAAKAIGCSVCTIANRIKAKVEGYEYYFS